MKSFWDQRYNQKEYVYGKAPNEFFKQTLSTLSTKGNKILLPAEGDGRNALHAALNGWDVYAFDVSSVAREKALQLVKGEGVSISYDIQSYDNLQLPTNTFDVAALIYAHMPSKKRLSVHQQIIHSLTVGGVLILEAFDEQQLAYDSGGPKDIDMLYTVDMLRADFASMQIELLEKQVITLSEGSYHQGQAAVVRMIAYT